MMKSSLLLPELVSPKFSWLTYLPILVSLIGCAAQDFPSYYEKHDYLQASVDVVNQSFREDPTGRGKFLDSPGKPLADLNFAINRDDRDALGKLLRQNGGLPYVNRSIQPANLATLVADNDTLPGPVSSISKRSPSHFGFLYGVQLIGKGSGSTGSSTRMTYLEPFGYATYGYDLPDNKGYLFGGLGPYIAYGLWGKIKSGTYSANTFDSQTGFSRFDAGLGLTAGYQLPQGLRLSLVREIGLVNIQRNNPDEKVYNRVWSFNVAYPLKRIVALVKKK